MAHIDMDGLILDDETGEIVEAAEWGSRESTFTPGTARTMAT